MWDALKDHLVGRTGYDAERARQAAWAKAPADFSYPWGYYWWSGSSTMLGKAVRPKSRPRYATRRMPSADRRMLNRITSRKPPEPPHPDQLYLF